LDGTGKRVYLLQNLPDRSGAHLPSYSVGIGVLAQEEYLLRTQDVRLTTDLQLFSRLGISGAIHLVPTYAFVV